MSDDPTRPLGPDDRTRPLAPDQTRPLNPMGSGPGRLDDQRASRARTAMALAAVAVLLLVVVLLLVSRGGDDPTVVEPPSPTETSTDPEPTDSPSATPTDTESPTEEPDDEPREPTDTDAAEFSAAYRPEGAQAVQSATADLDGDGRSEVVFASIHSDSARIDIARWDGREYQVVYTGQGGGAERLDDFRVADYTGDGTREVVTMQSVGAQGQSLSIWGWNGQAFAPQRASGGCWNGSHTFGIIGASIERGRIRASCDGSPLPAAAWPSDVYGWDADRGGWVYEHTEE